ncbi:MAG TPA: DUF4349 domain-containing protein [Rubrobacteraceae bacterium]|nr:DUF4349 domain-containing protein [Rubrobacteraceae bacterium]
METRPAATALAAGALLLLALVLSACGERGGEASTSGGLGDGISMMEDRAAPRSGGEADMPSSGGGELAAAQTGASDELSAVGDFDRKIVKTAELGVRAERVRDAAASAQRIAADFGGSVLSSRVEGDGPVSAALVLVVPSPEFEAALDELRGLGQEVTTDTVRGEDVTEEFVDLESRERNLLAAEASLLELYDRAQSVNAALAIERELANIRGQIEQVQGRIQYLEDRTASSRISLSIEPVARSAPEPPAWSPARVVARSWDASLAVLQALATVVLSALVFGWWLVPVLVAGFVWWRRRALRSVRP